MSGTGKFIEWTTATGDARIDGLLAATKWADATVSFSFPTWLDYPAGYGGGEHVGQFNASIDMQNAARFALDTGYGTAANDGFSVEGFTGLNIEQGSLGGSHLRISQTTSDPYGYGTAWGYYPGTGQADGDLWFSSRLFDYSTPKAGNYNHATMLHEIGHTLGLDHAQAYTTFGTVPSQYDAMEYTIMTYKSYENGPTNGYTNEFWSYAQTYMMLDIAALQHLYGADYTTNSGNTVYSWAPDSGRTLVNGGLAIDPGANRIFATIWDGGGVDTYDLRAYASDLVIDLAPGGHSRFSTTQVADLGNGHDAKGNIYNALLHMDDLRSLIENAKGGSGDDVISGNQGRNKLWGGDGDDILHGMDGNDTLLGQGGADESHGGNGNDTIKSGGGNDRLYGQNGKDTLHGGGNRDALFGNNGADRLFGNNGNDRIIGGGGNDLLKGGNGNDMIIGGKGSDTMFGNVGSDTFRFNDAGESPNSNKSDTIMDFESGSDRLDFSGMAVPEFTLAIDGAFSGTGPSIVIRKVGADTIVRADVDGDGLADFRVTLDGTASVDAGDFIL